MRFLNSWYNQGYVQGYLESIIEGLYHMYKSNEESASIHKEVLNMLNNQESIIKKIGDKIKASYSSVYLFYKALDNANYFFYYWQLYDYQMKKDGKEVDNKLKKEERDSLIKDAKYGMKVQEICAKAKYHDKQECKILHKLGVAEKALFNIDIESKHDYKWYQYQQGLEQFKNLQTQGVKESLLNKFFDITAYDARIYAWKEGDEHTELVDLEKLSQGINT